MLQLRGFKIGAETVLILCSSPQMPRLTLLDVMLLICKLYSQPELIVQKEYKRNSNVKVSWAKV